MLEDKKEFLLSSPEDDDDDEDDDDGTHDDHHLDVLPPVLALQSGSRFLELRSSLLKHSMVKIII